MMSLYSGNHSHALAENVRGHEPAPGLTVERSHQWLMISATAKQFLESSHQLLQEGFSCWTVTKSRHKQLFLLQVFHCSLPATQCAESAFCTSTPRAAIQREKRLWTFEETTFPTPSIIYFIFSCKWFYCSCSFHGMTTKGRPHNDLLNSWWQF